MLLSVILFMLSSIPSDANDVTRDFFGDIFRMRDCHNGSRCDNGGRRAALQVPGRPCYCQCAPSHLAYREDKQQCVKDIKECYMSVFYRPFTVEAIPLVYLPTSGQLVHPDAHLSLSMRRNIDGTLAKCRVTVSQYLTREGWRTLTKMDGTGGSIFGLFTDANKTYLQFLGTSHDRKLLQQHMVLVRLLCVIPQYPAFETCVAVRIGWVPGVENIEDMPAPSNKANMMVVGLSLGVLALVYIFAVLVYLKIRRQMIVKQKTSADQEAKLQSLEDSPDKVPNLHRMETSNRLELYHSSSLGKQKHLKKGFRNNCDPWNQMSPIVETYNRTWTDRMGQHSSEFRAQDFKLQPEFFEPEFMASPPHEVLEYLERLQNSITFARHRMRSCYRYQPTLNGIPEDDYFYQELENKDPQSKEMRTTPDGGSASSVGSLQESSEQSNDGQQKEYPKIPPRKPKRKTVKEKAESSPESAHSSDQEQKEIQKAMNTLNDTLDALEYDMYKQEILQQTSDSETANLSCQNSTSIDFDDFETSSCSSMSVVTVLGREAKRLSDISKCSQEKNLSEEISTFSNSTYSICGLFHDGNKSSCNNEIDKSNISSRCPSRNTFLSQTEENTKGGQNKDHKMNIKETDSANNISNSENLLTSISRPKSRADNVNSNHGKRNANDTDSVESDRENSTTPNPDPGFKNVNIVNHQEIEHKNCGSFGREHKNLSSPNQGTKQRNKGASNHQQNTQRNITPSLLDIEYRRVTSSQDNRNSRAGTPNRVTSPHRDSRNSRASTPNRVTSPNQDSKNSRVSTPNRVTTPQQENRSSRACTPNQDSTRRNLITPNKEPDDRNISTPNKENNHRKVSRTTKRNIDSPNLPENGLVDVNTPNLQENEHKNLTDPDGYPIRKSPSSESLKTVATDMTTDSLDSRCTTPNHPSPTPSLMEMWINKLVSTSVPYSKNRRKSKKKLILPEDEVDSWEHVCQKHKDPCPMHDLNDSEPNLIDKLAHYGSKTMAGCDVAGYFQSLKQDVLKEHLKLWLSSNNQSKKHKGIALEDNNECSHKKPLVNGQENNLVDENGMHLSSKSSEVQNETRLGTLQDASIPDDSLESESAKKLKANGTIYFGGMKETSGKTVET